MKAINRRGFIKTCAVSTALMASSALLSGCDTKGTDQSTEAAVEVKNFEEGINWGNEYDVIVIGFGAAGAATAITAAGNNANVLIVEKAPKMLAGGNSRVCGQRIATVAKDKREDAIACIKAMRGNFTTLTDDMIEVYVDELMNNESWMLDVVGVGEFKTIGTVDFPNLPGAGSIVNKCAFNTAGWDAKAYHALKAKVESMSNIDVWYQAPALELIQDPATKVIHGVKVKVDGSEVLVRAKNGVVMCLGGHEANAEMHQNYFMQTKLNTVGNAVYNTGDGVKMASVVGAQMWHMANLVTDFDFVYPDTNIVCFGTIPMFAKTGIVMVDGNGRRFRDDATKSAHGKLHFADTEIQAIIPNRMFAFFNKEMMDSVDRIHPKFSLHNEEELASGWIMQGNTVEELAEKMGVPASGLAQTIEEVETALVDGEDVKFGRDVTTMKSLKNGPYYAVEMFPGIVNTMGGAKRNKNGEIVDYDNNPIPHLYGAGEFGDIWAKEYQGSCNFGGGLVFGRITGKNASSVKADSTQEDLVKPENKVAPKPKEEKEFECAENQFIGKSFGMGGEELVVRVTTSGSDITNVEILQSSETPRVSDRAAKQVPQSIIDNDTADVDTVSGATVTSNAIKNAVKNALGMQ